MKKKILSVILMLSMVAGLTACGSKEPSGITIEGKKYDLSGDFQEVVGSMAEDDLQVIYGPYAGIDKLAYDEDGKLAPAKDFDKNEAYIYASERQVPVVSEDDDLECFIQRIYMIDKNAEFETKLGFGSESEKKEIKELDGFIKTSSIINRDSDTYVALFVDGKMVKFTDYEETLEEWKDELDNDGFMKTYEDFFSNTYGIRMVCKMFNADFVRFSNTYDELQESVEKLGIPLEEEVLLALAMEDACELMEEGEAESVVVVRVEITKDDEVIMEYDEFYFDEDWDSDKFKK